MFHCPNRSRHIQVRLRSYFEWKMADSLKQSEQNWPQLCELVLHAVEEACSQFSAAQRASACTPPEQPQIMHGTPPSAGLRLRPVWLRVSAPHRASPFLFLLSGIITGYLAFFFRMTRAALAWTPLWTISALSAADNAVSVPRGGSHLDASERSKLLGSLRIRLGDASPVGDEAEVQQLRRGRLYD